MTATQTQPADQTEAEVSAVVWALYDAFRDRQRDVAETLIGENFSFTSPYDDHIDRTAFFERCWPNGDRFSDFRVELVQATAEGAFVTYLVTTQDDMTFRNTEYLTVVGGKVASVDVYFGASYQRGRFVAKQPDSNS